MALVLSLAATMLVTGALHEDGLADAADGLGGGSTPERVFEIMKDSRIGTYGAIALILSIIMKLASLASLSRVDIVLALITGHTLARWSSVVLLYRYAYVGTKGVAFAGGVTMPRLIIASIIALVLSAFTLHWRTIIPILATLAVGPYFKKRLGGVTGDCLGAANQLVEIAVYLALATNI